MALCLPVLYYCVVPGAESCLCRRATREGCAVQAQHRVRIARRTMDNGKTRVPLCCARVALQHAARLAAAQAQHYNYLHHAMQLHSPSRFPKLKYIAFRCLTGTTQAQAQIKA
jgi:hypothetical protein